MIFIDVREKDEFNKERIKDSINIPFSNFIQAAPIIINNLQDQEITLICSGGQRSQMALHQLKKIHINNKIFQIYEGGINAWKAANKEVICGNTSNIPLMRRIQLGAGFLIVLSIALSYFYKPDFIFGTLFMGAGLVLAGFIGFYSLILILKKMPWNRV